MVASLKWDLLSALSNSSFAIAVKYHTLQPMPIPMAGYHSMNGLSVEFSWWFAYAYLYDAIVLRDRFCGR